LTVSFKQNFFAKKIEVLEDEMVVLKGQTFKLKALAIKNTFLLC